MQDLDPFQASMQRWLLLMSGQKPAIQRHPSSQQKSFCCLKFLQAGPRNEAPGADLSHGLVFQLPAVNESRQVLPWLACLELLTAVSWNKSSAVLCCRGPLRQIAEKPLDMLQTAVLLLYAADGQLSPHLTAPPTQPFISKTAGMLQV